MELITAAYTDDQDEVQVVVSGYGKAITRTAPDLIAARELADQLVGQVAPAGRGTPVVVHLLNGSATAFTRAYLVAQHGAPSPRPPGVTHPSPSAPAEQDRPHQDI